MYRRKLIQSAALALFACFSSSFPFAAEFRAWSQLSPQEMAALAPVASSWDSMPAKQQEKLLAVAREYQKLSPERQRVLHSRLRSWSRLTSEERQIARDNYKKIHALPKQDQTSIRQQWLDSLCQEFGQVRTESTRPEK